MSLNTRLDRLEQAVLPSARLIVLAERFGDTEDQAKARWRSDNPGQTLHDSDLVVFIKRFSPGADAARYQINGGEQ